LFKLNFDKKQQQANFRIVIDENEFWGRVSSGRECVDTLIREVAVRATLTSGEFQEVFVRA
jgi:hypothetical protein